MKSIFSKIIDRELSADIVWEDEQLIAIKDIHPQAPVHLLLIPKKPIKSLQEMSEEDAPLMVEVLRASQQLAREMGIEKGYRLLTNVGKEGGQSVFHLHFHLLGGETLENLC